MLLKILRIAVIIAFLAFFVVNFEAITNNMKEDLKNSMRTSCEFDKDPDLCEKTSH